MYLHDVSRWPKGRELEANDAWTSVELVRSGEAPPRLLGRGICRGGRAAGLVWRVVRGAAPAGRARWGALLGAGRARAAPASRIRGDPGDRGAKRWRISAEPRGDLSDPTDARGAGARAAHGRRLSQGVRDHRSGAPRPREARGRGHGVLRALSRGVLGALRGGLQRRDAPRGPAVSDFQAHRAARRHVAASAGGYPRDLGRGREEDRGSAPRGRPLTPCATPLASSGAFFCPTWAFGRAGIAQERRKP